MPIQRRTFLHLAAAAPFAGSAVTLGGAGAVPGLPPVGDKTARNTPLPPGAESRFATLNGVRLHYVIAGSGPALVLLHGWPQTWFSWLGTMRSFADRFTVIAPDLRGLGLSERTAVGYDKRTVAEDIKALIDHEAGGRVVVVGHDMGGKAAYVLAHLHPDTVSRLVLVDCLLPGTENADALHGGAWHYGFHMAPDIPEMLTAGRERDYIRAQIRAWSHRKDAVTEAAVTEYARHYATPGGMTAGFDYYRALPRDAVLMASFGERTLAMPVLAVAGRQSVAGRLGSALRSRSAHLSEVLVEACGHFVAEEAPGPFHDAIRHFLSDS